MSAADIIDQVIEHRAEIRQRVVNFLSPDQVIKWDADALQHRLVVLAERDDGTAQRRDANPDREELLDAG